MLFNPIQEVTGSVALQIKTNTAEIEITKTDEQTKEKLSGVEFELREALSGKVIGTYVTDSNGKIVITGLYQGEYVLKEIKAREEYILNIQEENIIIQYNETVSIEITNELKKGSVKIIKVDNEDNTIKLANVVFEVLDKNGNLLETIKTDENGEAVTKEYIIRDFDKIYLREVNTREGYILNDNITEVKLEANKVKEVFIQNQKMPKKLPNTRLLI